MYRMLLTALASVFFSALLFAQSERVHVSVESVVDTSNPEISSAIKEWEQYLNSRPDSVYANPYWSQKEQLRYKPFDLVGFTWWQPNMFWGLHVWTPTVLSVSMEDSLFVIRTMFYRFSKEDPRRVNVPCIIQTGACRENGNLRLCNILPFNTRFWHRGTIGSITFISPPEHNFNQALAGRMSQLIDSLAAAWNLKTVPVEYYFADDFERVIKALGFDYWPAEGNTNRPRGITDWNNRIIYGGGSGEWYPHEFVHIYINPLFPHAHHYFLEGYATSVGGSRGRDLLWHLQRYHEYFRDHPETEVLFFKGVERFIDASYVIGGMLCKMAEEKGGLPLLKKLMGYEEGDENLYHAIRDVFGVEKKQVDSFLRAKLAEYASH
jgi:hypothetical protein